MKQMARTNVELDARVVKAALALTRLPTKKAVVNFALEYLVSRKRRKAILQLFGSGCWRGNLDRWRMARAGP